MMRSPIFYLILIVLFLAGIGMVLAA